MKSLSNLPDKQNHREIKLRPIIVTESTKSSDKTARDELMEQHQTLVEKINQAENRLKKVDQDIATKRNQLELELKQARENWQVEKEALIKKTKQTATEDGYQEGKKLGFEAVKEKIIQADQIIELAKDEQKKIIDQSESILLELATKIANKIVTYEIKENDAFLKMVKVAIQEVHGQPQVQIFTSNEDYYLIQGQRDQLLTLLEPEVVLSIHPDEKLNSGDCLIKTPYSKLDVSVDKQLTKIKTRLIEVMEEIKREDQ